MMLSASSQRLISPSRQFSTINGSIRRSGKGSPSHGETPRGRPAAPTCGASTSCTPEKNRFLAVRELKIQGLRTPHYNRRADLVCFVNGLPVVFIELKAVYVNIRAGFDNNITDYKDTIPHAFHHNAFLIVS